MRFFLLILGNILTVQCLNINDNIIINITTAFDNQDVKRSAVSLGPCKIVVSGDCPNPEIRYYLYTHTYSEIPEEVQIGAEPFASNLTQTSFNPLRPTKIIIHGYNSGMRLNALIEIKNQYLIRQNTNVFAIDWGPLANGPCYPAAVWNARTAGKCSALLVDRLREFNIDDIHVIGFSLGAHVSAFLANALLPYKLSRITGLDPAMPGFTTVGTIENNGIRSCNARFVDVVHTNAFFQGQIQESGHVDFYLNGGVIQPGCWADERFIACNHHRAPYYFAESINSERGFWGWPCPNYFVYLLGRCPPQNPQTLMGEHITRCPNYFVYLLGRCPPQNPQTLMGEHITRNAKGMHLVITDSVSPFAVGPFTGPTIDILKKGNAFSDHGFRVTVCGWTFYWTDN
ncbi:Lipase [Popillia japonica]|uniref:Lipase n=1 Tax=Popillia japonica TaxID=7064 RepID=A0AAW1JHD9_POPJA